MKNCLENPQDPLNLRRGLSRRTYRLVFTRRFDLQHRSKSFDLLRLRRCRQMPFLCLSTKGRCISLFPLGGNIDIPAAHIYLVVEIPKVGKHVHRETEK